MVQNITASRTVKLEQALAAALTQHALPGELAGFTDDDAHEAAAMVARAIAVRRPDEPSLLIDSTGGGAGQRATRLAVVNDDMPFLVDSITGTITAHGLTIRRLLHPVLSFERNRQGHVVGVDEADGDRRESVIYLEFDRVGARDRAGLADEILAVLADVRAAVDDWGRLKTAMRDAAERVSDREGATLIEWFAQGSLTILGHRLEDRDGGAGEGLGILRREGPALWSEAARAAAFAWFERGGDEPLLAKSDRVATVHRRAPLDLVVTARREAGRVAGLDVTAGLWTSAALAESPDSVPVLRAHLAALDVRHGFDASAHSGKAFLHAVGALPRDVTTALDAEALETLALTAMSLIDRPRTRLLLIPDALGQHLIAFAWLPRDEMSTGRRREIEAMLIEATEGTLLSWSVDMRDDGLAMLRYTLSQPPGAPPPDADALDQRLVEAVRGWVPALEARLAERVAPGRAARLALTYGTAFPAGYRVRCTPEEAAEDVLRLATLSSGDARGARLYRLPSDGRRRLRLRIYRTSELVALSDVVPMLENFGFRVLEEFAFSLENGAHGNIHDLTLELAPGLDGDALLERRDVIEQAITGVLEGRAENDPFNELIATVSLDPASVVLLRAWFRYLRQTGVTYGQGTVVEALKTAPAVTNGLIALFRSRHDPSLSKIGKTAEAEARSAIEQGLSGVAAIDEDRILRLYRSVVLATLRTNAFVPASEEALAFKFDSAGIPGLPSPVPWREIWVYSPRVEGIHLRGGPVARGGIRWSDRRDDFRTEILGLMKAQVVKNAVIVPTGAKGGFYPKQLPPAGDREAWMAEGTEAYRIFIRTLLSVTDNYAGSEVIHPAGMLVLDDNDPYFVVAADKGTASFSDIANDIAIARDFWLGDAFASGGSHGYDHKVMGITARGAWVSVTRHFAEMGTDIQTEPVSVAGVGDMSGDVFGNGMLLSKAIRLIVAFDHRHIFFDPEPDTGKSWTERKRLFGLPRSSWADYDAKLISKGGGIFPRSQKSIPLSPEVRAMLGITDEALDPSALITAILKAPIDLLFFGGIGTYVKARSQSQADAGDRANDANRVNGDEVRAKVIGEGANLGATQAGRIEYAARGGRINTDFIDNSAGVDCSDNEVNIKIPLNAEMAASRLSFDDRNTVLISMTEDVAALVLEDNRLQTLALSIAERGGAAALPTFVRITELLEAGGRFDRAVEGIDSNEALLRRGREGNGLTRPELAVLLSHAKLALQDAIERAPLPDDPIFADDLHNAFPPEMRKRFESAIDAHRLRREIIATKLANRLVNRLGLAAPFTLAEEEGASLAQIAGGFAVIERLFDLGSLWRDIDEAAMAEATRLTLFTRVSQAARLHIANLLRNTAVDATPSALLADIGPGVKRIGAKAQELLRREARIEVTSLRASLVDSGADAKLVDRIVDLFVMDGAIGTAALAQRGKGDELTTATAYVRLGEALGLDWAKAVTLRLAPIDPWERLLTAGLSRDFEQLRLDFLARHGRADPLKLVDDWLKAQAPRIDQFRQLVARIRAVPQPTPAMLAQVASQARVLLARQAG
jgi:glutamate dehydrogenase